jgi:hypothetical protein
MFSANGQLLCLGIYILYKVEPAALVMASYPIVYVIPCFCANSACFYKLVQIEGISIFQNGTFMPK